VGANIVQPFCVLQTSQQKLPVFKHDTLTEIVDPAMICANREKVMIQLVFALMLGDASSVLHLICPGVGTDTKVNVASASAFASNGQSATINAYQRRAVDFDDQLEIEIIDGQGRVRLPSRVVPLNHGGKNGWYEVKGLQVGNDAIDGKVPINFTNAPRLHISRISGAVTIEGRDGSFSGRCQAYDPEKVQHAF